MGFRFFIERRRSRLLRCWLPVNLILPTLTVGPSLILKLICTEAGGMVLTSVLMVANWWPCSASNSLRTVFGPHHLGGVVLALNGEADLLLLEAIEDVGVGDGAIALVIDLADGGLFADENIEDDALLRVFALNAQVFKVAGVPEGIEVALDRDGIVDVAGMGEHSGEDGLLGNAAVADDPDRSQWSAACWARAAPAEQKNQQQNEPGEQRKAGVRELREMKSCLIFTGLESCGEHKYWCGPR